MRFLSAMIVFGITILAGAMPANSAERIDLKVLYTGCPDSPRLKAFQSFLEENFTQVDVADTSLFQEGDAADYDVVIFDWQETYDGKGGIVDERRLPKPPRLTRDFDRPAILIGETGGRVTSNLKLKLDWLCLCLEDAAHELALDHEVFHQPLEVAPQFEEIDTPEEYHMITLQPPKAKMKVWKVQTKNYPEIDPGLVSNLYGFTDSPDCELFAKGIAGKGPDSVALGRQANYFLWGFSARPTDMSPAARRLFVNAVCYISRFDGARPLVQRTASAREWALRYAKIPQDMTEEALETEARRLRRMLKEHPEWIPEEHNRDAEAYIKYQVKRISEANDWAYESYLPEDLRKRFGMDAEKYAEYYSKNLEFLHPNENEEHKYQFVVDEDVKSLGLSNRKPELLDRCIKLLADPQQSELAQRILDRYTTENFKTRDEWQAWLNSHRDRLFFSDTGGYKFHIQPEAAESVSPASTVTDSQRKTRP